MNNLAFLLAGIECKADHPITCLNPSEWFIPTDIRGEYREWEQKHMLFVRGENTCWWRLDQVEIRRSEQFLHEEAHKLGYGLVSIVQRTFK